MLIIYCICCSEGWLELLSYCNNAKIIKSKQAQMSDGILKPGVVQENRD